MPPLSLCHVNVVLVNPQIAANVGFAARCAKGFGAGLSLVHDHPERLLTSEAYRTARGAEDLLHSLPVHPTVRQAVRACPHVAGFSRRGHAFERPQLLLRQWAQNRFDPGRRTALLFGAEDFGLSNQDKHLCDVLVRIPSEAETLSLNLSHAAAVVLYELYAHVQNASWVEEPAQYPVPHQQRERLLQALIEGLEPANFFKPGRKHYQIEELRSMILRLPLNEDEYHTWMGVLTALCKRKEM